MRRILLMPVIALLAVFFTALPANAATIESYTIDGDDVDTAALTVGDDAEIAWETTTSEGTVSLVSTPTVAGFDEADAATSDSKTVTFSEAGTFALTLDAQDEGGQVAETITVTVTEPTGPTEIPVPDVTFPEPCVVVLPAVDNVTYGVSYGEFGDQVQPGTYDLIEFLENGIPLEFVAAPAEGFAFPDGADNRFEITRLEECFGTVVESGLVETRAICQGVTFTNIAEDDLFVAYGSEDEDDVDGDFELAAGASRTIETDRDLLAYFAVADSLATFQVNEVAVEQDCVPADRRAAFPTVAPAAGESGSGVRLAALSVLGAALLAGAGIAIRRRTV